MTNAYRFLLAAILLVATAAGAEDVGTVAATRGAADIGHGGVWSPAAVGMTVQLKDELRTGTDGQLRVVFRDDSVIDLSESSSLVVDEQVFDPDAGRFSSIVRLLQGKARALVSAYYKTPGAAYEVETPTAVAGVRGTSFLVAYNPDVDSTEVIGIHGRVEVRSLAERIGGAVYVTEHETTTVMRDEAPTAPAPVDDQRFHHEIGGLQALSLNNIAGSAASRPLGAGASVPAPERAPSTSGGIVGQIGRDQLRNPGDVAGQPLNVVGNGRGSLGVPF
jgi:hypothetical protein